MKIKELQEELTKIKRIKIKQSDIARAMGISREAVNQRYKNNSDIPEERIKEIEKYFNVNLTECKEVLTNTHGCTVEEYELIMKFLNEEKDLALYAAKAVINKDNKALERFIKLMETLK
jgi:transcriptional regulator with XRE-family HTH domain